VPESVRDLPGLVLIAVLALEPKGCSSSAHFTIRNPRGFSYLIPSRPSRGPSGVQLAFRAVTKSLRPSRCQEHPSVRKLVTRHYDWIKGLAFVQQ
jgi:hypothetical protein